MTSTEIQSGFLTAPDYSVCHVIDQEKWVSMERESTTNFDDQIHTSIWFLADWKAGIVESYIMTKLK